MLRRGIAFIGRAHRYSPNSVDKDDAILVSVRQHMLAHGFPCLPIVSEDAISVLPAADVFLSMGRHPFTTSLLDQAASTGSLVANSPSAVSWCCHRAALMCKLEADGLAVPPAIGNEGYWVKRGDGCSEHPDDVCFVSNLTAAERQRANLMARGACSVEIRAHVAGDVLKCYGVSGTPFFRYYYPGDDGSWKFPHEDRNGRPRHYAFSEEALRRLVADAAHKIGLGVYGADCVIRPDGTPTLVDLNDWPSFSRCREEAADAIVQHVKQQIEP